MKDLLKKISVPGYLSLGAGLATLVALILVAVASAGVYPIAHVAIAIVLSVLGLLFDVAYVYCEIKGLRKLWADLFNWLGVVCLCVALSITIYGRSELMGFVWFSDLMSGNAVARSALNTTLVAWILYLLAAIALIVSSGWNSAKKAD